MNRCTISLIILAALILLCIISLPVIHGQCDRLVRQTDRVAEAAVQGDAERALAEYEKLEQRWESFHDITGLFVDGEKLDVPREVICALRPLLAAAHPEAVSELARLRGMIEGLYEEEVPGWAHIL